MIDREQSCIDFILKQEGGLTEDSGGLTKFGISQRAYPQLDIRGLTEDQARAIYHDDYWRPLGCDELAAPLDLLMVDAGVNCGVSRAGKWLQEAINGELPRAPIAVDGVIGPHTMQAAAFCDVNRLAFALLNRRLFHYYCLRKSQPESFGGWVGRMADLLGVVAGGIFESCH